MNDAASLTPCSEAVRKGLNQLLPHFVRAVAGVLRVKLGDKFWMQKEVRDAAKDTYRGPQRSATADGWLETLSVRSCCQIVFAFMHEFDKQWKINGIALVNLVRDADKAVNEGAGARKGPTRPKDIPRMDASFHLTSILRFCDVVAAGQDTKERIRRIRSALVERDAGNLLPAVSDGAVAESEAREASGGGCDYRPWFLDGALRGKVEEASLGIGAEDVRREIMRRLKAESDGCQWRGPRYVTSEGEPPIPDEPVFALVAVLPESGKAQGGPGMFVRGMDVVDNVLMNSGPAWRRYVNSIAFILSDEMPYRMLECAVADYLALSSIRAAPEGAPADAAMEVHIRKADSDASHALRAAFSNVAVPSPDWRRDARQYRTASFEAVNIFDGAWRLMEETGAAAGPDRPCGKGDGWSSEALLATVERLHGDGRMPTGFIRISDLWAELCSDCRLPRLMSERALLSSVASGASKCQFVYAYDIMEKARRGKAPAFRYDWTTPEVRPEGFVVRLEDAVKAGWRPPLDAGTSRLKGQGLPFQ